MIFKYKKNNKKYSDYSPEINLPIDEIHSLLNDLLEEVHIRGKKYVRNNGIRFVLIQDDDFILTFYNIRNNIFEICLIDQSKKQYSVLSPLTNIYTYINLFESKNYDKILSRMEISMGSIADTLDLFGLQNKTFKIKLNGRKELLRLILYTILAVIYELIEIIDEAGVELFCFIILSIFGILFFLPEFFLHLNHLFFFRNIKIQTSLGSPYVLIINGNKRKKAIYKKDIASVICVKANENVPVFDIHYYFVIKMVNGDKHCISSLIFKEKEIKYLDYDELKVKDNYRILPFVKAEYIA